MKHAELVPDDLWEAIAPLLPEEPPKPKGGRPRVPDRAALGGGIVGELFDGSPKAQLAILPNTAHLGVPLRTALLLAMIPAFLDAPAPGADEATPTA